MQENNDGHQFFISEASIRMYIYSGCGFFVFRHTEIKNMF